MNHLESMIHKVNTPLRPIVSCVNIFAYDLSSYLADVLSPEYAYRHPKPIPFLLKSRHGTYA